MIKVTTGLRPEKGFAKNARSILQSMSHNSLNGPCTIADLGEGKLIDFVKTDFGSGKLDPRRVKFKSGHVYLLKHQQSLKHVVLFRVELQKQSADNGSAVQAADK